MRSLKRFYDNASDIIVNIYMSGMLGIYPFFMRTGYVGLSDAKYSFFLISSLIAIVLLFFTGFPRLISSVTDKIFNAVHIAVFLFAVVSILSFSFSGYKDTALFGANEWYMGLVTILVLCAMIYLISILWKPNFIIVYGATAVSAAVYILAIFDRFSFYIIPLSVRDPSFISTLGNINWFMGYYSIMTPLGIGLLLYDRADGGRDREGKLKTALLFVYAAIAFICGFAQGAESVFLVFAAMFVLLLISACKKLISLQDLLILMIIWCLSAQVIRVIRMIFPQAYNYADRGVCSFLTSNGITAVSAVVPVIMLLIMNIVGSGKKEAGKETSDTADHSERSRRSEQIILIFLWILLAAVITGYIIISLIKTNTDMFPGITNSVFFWDRRFGSGRGEAFRIALSAISRMNFGQKLTGVGPDCFENFVYSIDELRNDLYEIFNNSRLVNAHCSLLTLFINEGVLGIIAYTAIPVTFVHRVIRRYKDEERFKIIALSVSLAIICAFTHDMISFTHILNVPFAAVLIGMVLAFL